MPKTNIIENAIKQSVLYDTNAVYYGYSINRLMERAGMGIADAIINKYGKGKRVGIFCGPGNNGGDGLVAARYLLGRAEVSVYLVVDSKKIKGAAVRKNWRLFKGFKKDNINAKDIPNDFDIVVDCLFGTGVHGKLRQPYREIVQRLNKIKGRKISIDLPTPGYKAKYFISLMLAKVPRAKIVDIGFPEKIKEKIGPGEVKILHQPSENSHKGDNGRLLIVAGSNQYHGALLLAAKIAAKVADLVYTVSTTENNKLINKLKVRFSEFVAIPKDKINNYLKKSDAVLLGPGLGINSENKKLINTIVKRKNKKIILDADALKMVNKKLLHKNCLLTPHKKEFKSLFKLPATKKNAAKMSRKYRCVIVLKGKTDFVASPKEVKENYTGNIGMTKGGTGDVLAGLIAALACKNDLFLSACAGTFLNGLAGDRLYAKYNRFYSAGALIRELPRAFKWSLDFGPSSKKPGQKRNRA